MEFPQYRRYKNGKSYFKVESPSELFEIQVIGAYFVEHRLKAKILPEQLLIKDLIEANPDNFEVIDEHDFHAFMEENHKNRIFKKL